MKEFIKITVFWNVTYCSLVHVYSSVLKMEAARVSETPVNCSRLHSFTSQETVDFIDTGRA
jgi:hypothetical protein